MEIDLNAVVFALNGTHEVSNSPQSPKYKFYVHALCQFYNLDPVEGQKLDLMSLIPNFEQIEKKLHSIAKANNVKCPFLKVGRLLNESLTNPLSTLKWRHTALFNEHDPFNFKYILDYRLPELKKSTCILFNDLGDDRFCFVDIKGLVSARVDPKIDEFPVFGADQYWAHYELFSRGFDFGGRHFEFFGGEITRRENAKVAEGKSKSITAITAWFFATYDCYNELERMSVPQVRERLGTFIE